MSNKTLKVIAGTPDKPVKIGDIEIPCYVLENESRVFSKRGLFNAFGVVWGGGGQNRSGVETRSHDFANPENIDNPSTVVTDIPRFLNSNWIRPYISEELALGLRSPLLMETPTGFVGYGYQATTLVDVCDAILTAHLDGATTQRQEGLVKRARVLTNGFATIGIIGLIDEATGYQRRREERALAKILERYIAKNLQPWTRTFPYEFYEQVFRLKGWDGPNGVSRPAVIGHYTNDFVYQRLAPGVLDELRDRNPIQPSGQRRARHHQWFTPEHGHPKLREHIAGVVAIMKVSETWNAFVRNMNLVYPKQGTTIPFKFSDEE